jgi:hypothetical protein
VRRTRHRAPPGIRAEITRIPAPDGTTDRKGVTFKERVVFDRAATTTGIMHVGVGGFHRSHQLVRFTSTFESPESVVSPIVQLSRMMFGKAERSRRGVTPRARLCVVRGTQSASRVCETRYPRDGRSMDGSKP